MGQPRGVSVDAVREFHEMCGLTVGTEPVKDIKNAQEVDLRIRLIQEEFEELVSAITGCEAVVLVEQPVQVGRRDPNVLSVASEMADLLYVTLGAAVSFGIDIDAVFDAVHGANMRKRDANGKVIVDRSGKVVKPEGWAPASIKHALGYDQYGRTC